MRFFREMELMKRNLVENIRCNEIESEKRDWITYYIIFRSR